MQWAERVAYAVVGAHLTLPDTGPDPRRILDSLAAHGWGRDEIGAHARDLRAQELPWPGAVPAVWVSEAGAAQWHAVVGGVVRLLALDEAGTPAESARLTADERRLLADRPPHW